MTVAVHKLVLELVDIIKLIEMVFVDMLLCKHKYVLDVETVNQMVAVEQYVMIAVEILAVTLVVHHHLHQHVLTVQELDHVALHCLVFIVKLNKAIFVADNYRGIIVKVFKVEI